MNCICKIAEICDDPWEDSTTFICGLYDPDNDIGRFYQNNKY